MPVPGYVRIMYSLTVPNKTFGYLQKKSVIGGSKKITAMKSSLCSRASKIQRDSYAFCLLNGPMNGFIFGYIILQSSH